LIPYVEIKAFVLGPLRIPSQTLLAAAGILAAHALFLRRARRAGLDHVTAGWLSLTMALAGLAGAFLFRWAYLPEALSRDPWIWTKTTAGASSFGGLAGGVIAAGAYFRIRGIGAGDSWRYLDVLASAFPVGMLLGRAGCSLIHDHPGVRSEHWLAVRYPGFTRFDLAVLEVLFLGAVVIPGLWLLQRRGPAAPLLLGALLSGYGVFRVLLDRLHIDPPRYGWFSVDQLAYGSAAACGLAILIAMLRSGRPLFGGMNRNA
jgi:phosphatidylglycerol:prolipoprotein diacylglycerol transferase